MVSIVLAEESKEKDDICNRKKEKNNQKLALLVSSHPILS